VAPLLTSTSTPTLIVDHRREPRGRGPEPVKFFPPKHAARLLWEGYKIPGAETEPNIFLRYNVRNMMIALLDGWGGLRRSEGPLCVPKTLNPAIVVVQSAQDGA
jgi:hypothetical protein